MSRERAVHICNNLTRTISSIVVEPRDYIFDPPQAKKETLIKVRKRIMKKYKIGFEELTTTQRNNP